MSGPIPVVLVGYGYAGRTFHAPLICATPGLRLQTVVSSDPVRVQADHPEVRVAGDLAEALDGASPDLVVVATPNATHHDLAMQALTAGRHVVVDKPLAVTAAQGRALMAQAERGGRLLSVFHNRRWDRDFLIIKDLLREGVLGEIAGFESRFDRFRPEVRDRWRERDEPGAGIWYDLGSHLIDQALQLFGRPDDIFVDLARQRPGAEADDQFHALLRYPRLRVTLRASVLVADPPFRFSVNGDRGSYLKRGLDEQEDVLRTGAVPDESLVTDDGLVTLAGGPAEPAVRPGLGDYRAYYAGVRDAILGQGANPVPAEDAIAVLELLELGIESAKTGRAVQAGKPLA